ncbi:MAG TPA: hypothetical protein VNW92_25230 [Polyangiaceae bacterium]|jgi:hypothetical protein|nr:hypothetical protein [Polyangiaceae bacterium]
MGDPERLLKSGAVDPQVLELVKSLRGIAPEAGAGLSSWGAMAAKVATLPTVVPPPGAPVASGASASTSALGASLPHALGLKLLGVALASTVIGVGVHWAHTAHQKPAQAANVAAATAVVSPSQDPPAAANPEQDTPTSVSPSNGAPGSAGSGAHVSRLEAEASLLAKARSELHNGQPRAALGTLNQLQSSFPRGALSQEREVLAVEVLAANGNVAAAKRKANAFIAAHPGSPHSAKLERFVDGH